VKKLGRKARAIPRRTASACRTLPKATKSKPGEHGQVERARAGLVAALEKASTAGAEFVRVADAIAAAAVDRRESELVASMIQSRILSDLLELRRVFAARTTSAGGAEDDRLAPYLNVPAAILDWFCDKFGLQHSHELGAVVEIPRGRAESFSLSGKIPPGAGLLRIRVTAPGWKRRGKTIALPRAETV
jgi:hypothetical protein